MRTAFVNEITKLAQKDKNVWLVTGDLGFTVFEDFKTKFPDQFLNTGVAEQNLVSIAAGLAMTGKKVFVYSITTFISMRPFEQIRNDICYQNLPVCLIGGGSSFSYSTFGCTHFPLEDVGIMRTLPNLAIVVPGDPIEVSALINDAYKRKGPTYIRLAKRGELVVHKQNTKISLGQAIRLTNGKDVSILASGRQLPNAMAAHLILKKEGIDSRILSFHTVKPIDKKAIIKSAKETKGVVTVEEHFLNNGFGTAVAEVLSDNRLSAPLIRIGVPDEFPSGVGSQEYFLARYRLTPQGIVSAVKKILNKK